MMRFLPRSLFARLVLVLMSGLFVAQALSLAMHAHERGRLIAQASGMQSAQRIADIVRVLEPLSPEARRRMVAILSAPPLFISLAPAPAAAPRNDTASRTRSALFETMIERHLGARYPVTVTMTDAPPWKKGVDDAHAGAMHRRWMEGAGMGPGWMGGGWMGADGALDLLGTPGTSFVVQVGLSDGTSVVFDSRQPAETYSWPYRLLASVAILLVTVIALSLIAVRWATRPLKTLAEAADELGRNIDRPPLPETGPIEVQRAARAFNAMQAKLAEHLRERTRILAAMSHDLKTPITRLRLRAEMLDDTALKQKFVHDLTELEAMVARTLYFVRGVAAEEPVQPIDVAALVQSLQADLRETGHAVEISGTPCAPYPGRAQALKRCLVNLLDNAVKYGGTARMTIDDRDERLEICIADNGPGIPEADLERVFEPFYRLETSRSRETGGSGLGLSIARGIAENHGGTLVLRNRAQGGLEAVLTLPRRM